MDCNNCSIVSICKIYDTIKDFQQYANISIDQCKMKPEHKEEKILEHKIQNNIVLDKPIRDFTAISKQQKEIEEAKKEAVKSDRKPLTIIPVEGKAERISCPTCGGETTDDDLQVCGECGTTICSNCGTEKHEPNPLNPREDIKSVVCETCWNK